MLFTGVPLEMRSAPAGGRPSSSSPIRLPLGGLPGFLGTAAVASGLGIVALKKKLDGRNGPVRPSDRVGFATPNELKKWLSVSGLRNRAAVLRPSLAREKSRSISPHDLGYHLGTDLLHKKGLFLACEDLVLMYAPPRMCKSAQVRPSHAPGELIHNS
ncbi:hypothetical protein [Streptomyces sp. NPDC093598]|uniref:hypothetical protein n=1 Tax=Streptomyces sp. NPDC093598 TaxID=3366046 RepID=UPI00381621A6